MAGNIISYIVIIFEITSIYNMRVSYYLRNIRFIINLNKRSEINILILYDSAVLDIFPTMSKKKAYVCTPYPTALDPAHIQACKKYWPVHYTDTINIFLTVTSNLNA